MRRSYATTSVICLPNRGKERYKLEMYDFIIVGSGLFGAVFAQRAKSAGKSCLVLERRSHIGGNIYTEEIEGINVHKYGAHIFHTSDSMVWNYINEFADFKHSKVLHDHIVRINTMEEEADKLFMDCMYHLHGSCEDPFDVIAWREIYSTLEKCADACEHVADVVESTVMKNI